MSKFSLGKKSISLHRKLCGKIAVISKVKINSRADLSLYYTPGVGAVASYLASHKKFVRDFTIKRNSVAIISDGSAVLGLGNIGPEGALPVMEGKAMLFKEFSGVDAFPVVLNTQNVDAIVETVKNIAPVFGGINLEDISAPRCFEIEKRLQETLDIPVMHDDQHGTAIVVLAGLINAFKAAKKNILNSRIVVIGAGAAGNAITKLLLFYGANDILVLDSKGILSVKRKDLDVYKKELARITNRKNMDGGLDEAMRGADAVIGVSHASILKEHHVRLMNPPHKFMWGVNKKPIVFAMANPIPEIMPDIAKKAGAFIVATGRSDFPNQVNNALGFPGIFRGALDHRMRKITQEMKLRAAKNLAALIKNPSPNHIIPSLFDRNVVRVVAEAIQ